jgi:hypothetical protein
MAVAAAVWISSSPVHAWLFSGCNGLMHEMVCWYCLFLQLQHVVVSAEAVKAVAQHGQGFVKLPADMQQTLEGYLSGGWGDKTEGPTACVSVILACSYRRSCSGLSVVMLSTHRDVTYSSISKDVKVLLHLPLN